MKRASCLSCTGILWGIPSVLVYHVPSHRCWYVMHHPKFRAGVLCTIPGNVLVHPGPDLGPWSIHQSTAPLSSFQLQSQIWAVSCPHCSLHCFARGHRGHVGPFRPNGGLSATGDNKIADFSSHVVRVKESAARWWWLRSQTWFS